MQETKKILKKKKHFAVYYANWQCMRHLRVCCVTSFVVWNKKKPPKSKIKREANEAGQVVLR